MLIIVLPVSLCVFFHKHIPYETIQNKVISFNMLLPPKNKQLLIVLRYLLCKKKKKILHQESDRTWSQTFQNKPEA